MARSPIVPTDDEQEIVEAERDSHPEAHVRRRMLALRLPHNGITRDKTASIAGPGRATVQRYVAAFRDGALDGLRHRVSSVPPKKLTEHISKQKEFLRAEPESRPGAAQAGRGHVFFVDAAQFASGTFFCCLRSISRL